MKAMSKAVLSTAKDLLKANNTVTTLEIKLQVRRDYPYFYWDQPTISKYMDGFAGDGIFKYTDNGTYRTYSLVTTPLTSAPATKRASTRAILPVKGKAVFRKNLLQYVSQNESKITGLHLVTGKYITSQEIKGQKKSVTGYVVPRVHNLQALNVLGSKVTIK
jgi:hypothetical protein